MSEISVLEELQKLISAQTTSLVVTNLIKKNQKNYYCLEINPQGLKLGLMEHNEKKIINFNLSSGEIFKNKEKMGGNFFFEFKKKIDHILRDIKIKSARIYRGEL